MSRTTEPTTITQGERISWTKSFDDYGADEYTLQYRFRGPGTGLDVDATADGADFDVTMTAVLTDPQPFNVVGTYHWQAWLTEIADSTNSFIVEQGTIEVKQGFVEDSTEDVDLRSDAKIMLDAIDAALLTASGTSLNAVIEYEINTPAGGRRTKRSTHSELISMRKYYAAIVSRENHAARVANGGPWAKPINVRM